MPLQAIWVQLNHWSLLSPQIPIRASLYLGNIFELFLSLVAIFWAESGVIWLAGLALALGNTVGGWLGAHVSITRGERFIRGAFNVCIALLILKLLLG